MRLGFLGKSDLNINGNTLQHQNSLNELHRNTSGGVFFNSTEILWAINCILFLDIPTTAQNQFAWHPSGELHMSMPSNAGSVSLDTRLDIFWNIWLLFNYLFCYIRFDSAHKDASQDDVEVMSTDSSSSSSSDSQ